MKHTAMLVVGLLVAALGSIGCQGPKAVDSTLAIDYFTRGEAVTGTLVIPPIETLPEPWRDRALVLPTHAGKDYHVQAYYDDGSPLIDIQTSRSAVADAILGQIAGIDAEKFAQDRWMFEAINSAIDAKLAMLVPLIQAQLSKPPDPLEQGELKTLFEQVLTEWARKNGLLPEDGGP